jgi:hypothetical protein
MNIWRLLPFLLVAGCTTAESQGPVVGSPEWFQTASQKDMISFFRGQCVAAGVMPGSPEMAECIQREATLHNQPGIARSSAVAGATAGI